MTSCSYQLGAWVADLRFSDLPDDIVASTKLRVLDIVGLMLAGLGTPYGRSVLHAATALTSEQRGQVLGVGTRVGVPTAAFVNGALSQAQEFDDTHNESIVHMSGPSVAAGLALSESRPVTGKDLILSIAVGNEVSCRVGSVAPRQFHKRGFHPTGLFAGFGVAFLAGRILELDPARLANAAGIVGSFASGLLECWVDGTQSKYLHSGWAAQGGITAAHLGAAGTTGPSAVFEGRFGLFQSHLQDENAMCDFGRITRELGTEWESRNASFKPFPAAHVIHPYIDAILRLRECHGIAPDEIHEISVPVASYVLPIVCEPEDEKRRPKSDSHARVSMQYSLAEAVVLGRLGANAYRDESLWDPEILRVADRVRIHVDPDFPGPEQFKGAVRIVMTDGRTYETIEEWNRGSAQNPMSAGDIADKFHANAAGILGRAQREELVSSVEALEAMPDAASLVNVAVAR